MQNEPRGMGGGTRERVVAGPVSWMARRDLCIDWWDKLVGVGPGGSSKIMPRMSAKETCLICENGFGCVHYGVRE